MSDQGNFSVLLSIFSYPRLVDTLTNNSDHPDFIVGIRESLEIYIAASETPLSL